MCGPPTQPNKGTTWCESEVCKAILIGDKKTVTENAVKTYKPTEVKIMSCKEYQLLYIARAWQHQQSSLELHPLISVL